MDCLTIDKAYKKASSLYGGFERTIKRFFEQNENVL